MEIKASIKYIIIFALVSLLGLFFYFLNESRVEDNELKKRTVDSINWERTYDSKSKNPFGTYFIRNVLENGLENHLVNDIEVSIESYFDGSHLKFNTDDLTYFFVGKSFNLYNHEVDSLLLFVERGNTMFVSAEFLPTRLLEKVFYNYRDYNYFGYTNNTSVALTFEDSKFDNTFDINNQVKGKLKMRRWYNVNYGIEYGLEGRTIGKSGYRPCYMEFKYGKGKILIHTIPQVFTNSYLSSHSGKEYVEIVLSYFSSSTILFDNHTQFAYDNGTMDIDQPYEGLSGNSSRSLADFKTLDFLLTNQQLRWAYFILLAGILFFVLLTGKRQQKIIPTVSSNKNSSIEFTETIARLYLKQNQHNKLIVHMENIFKNKIKSKYYIASSKEIEYVERIAKKSGVKESEIQNILDLFEGSSNQANISDTYLINLYKKLNDFYKKAK